MISFNLRCSCGHAFEGWFRSGRDFDDQKERGLLGCPSCGGAEVAKALMAPSVTGTKRTRDAVEKGRSMERAAANAAESAGEVAGGVVGGVAGDDGGSAGPPTHQSAHIPAQLASDPRVGEVLKALRELRRRVTAEADYVGNRFAEEARKMHFGEADLRAIYGEATVAEAKELLEEGIEVAPLPILPEDRN